MGTTMNDKGVHQNSTGRRAQILALLLSAGGVSVEELADRLEVTASTIRRDLARLTVAGSVTRTLGGAVIGVSSSAETPLYNRAQEARVQKDEIGRWAANQIRDGETVVLDAGTTVGRVAHHLRGRSGLTVVTNGLTSLLELADTDDIDVIVLGGALRHISQGLVGPVTDMNLSRLSAHRVFLGADGLTADRGICEADFVQTRTKEIMASCGGQVYVLVDSSKLGKTPFNAWAPLERPWTLVTDSGADPEQLEPFQRKGNVEVVVVSRASS
jgi:DeoR/GlpR family transcriptional regulator of sugar metabolism